MSESRDIFTYVAPFNIMALNWSNRSDERFRLAIASSVFHSSPNAVVQILRYNPLQRARPASIVSFIHPVYSPNMLAFLPHSGCQHPDLLATAADCLRIWQINGSYVSLRSSHLITNYDAPATHIRVLDWNSQMTRRISTLNSEGVCTIWDVHRGAAELQLFTDRPAFSVQDVTWGSAHVLAAAYSDGNVKLVDLRAGHRALTVHRVAGGFADRVVWNYRSPNYLAVTGVGSTVVVLDPRRPEPLAEMRRHTATVNAIAWDPHSPRRICTAGLDKRALVWGIPAEGRRTEMVAEFPARSAIEQLKWSWLQPWCVAFATGNRLRLVHVPP